MQNFWITLGAVLLVIAMTVTIETSLFWNFTMKVSCLVAFYYVCKQVKVDNNTEEEL